MADYQKVAVDESSDGQIRMVRIDNMANNNALDLELINELGEAFKAADRDDDVQGIIFGSVGEMFCAGANLNEIKDAGLEGGTRWLNAYYDTLEVLKDTGKPTVGAVDGICVGGGQEMVVGCDLIVAGESAKFGQPEVKVGSTAGSGGLQMLPLMVGERRARDIMLTGRLLEAEEAKQIGLINRLVPDEEVEEKAIDVTMQIIENNSPQAYRVMKSVMKQWSNLAMLGWESQRELTSMVWDSEEFDERATSFMEGEDLEQRDFMGSQPDE